MLLQVSFVFKAIPGCHIKHLNIERNIRNKRHEYEIGQLQKLRMNMKAAFECISKAGKLLKYIDLFLKKSVLLDGNSSKDRDKFGTGYDGLRIFNDKFIQI